MLLPHSSTVDPKEGIITPHNRSTVHFIAAGVSENTMQEKANSNMGQNKIPECDTKFGEVFFCVCVCVCEDIHLIF